MSLFNSLSDFYNNLSSDGLFLFWILIFVFAFLVFLTIILLVKNNKLTKIILSERNSKVVSEESKEEKISDKENIKEEKQEKEESLILEDTIIPKEEVKIEVKKEIEPEPKIELSNSNKEVNVKKEENNLYQKNVLREMNAKMPTSPIHIDNKEAKEDKQLSIDISSYDDIITEREDSNISPLLEMEDNYSSDEISSSYLEEVTKKLSEEEKESNNIELTDYEKKQEEEAIISYNELQKVKDKIYNLNEEEEDDDFIDELKLFRSDL